MSPALGLEPVDGESLKLSLGSGFWAPSRVPSKAPEGSTRVQGLQGFPDSSKPQIDRHDSVEQCCHPWEPLLETVTVSSSGSHG